MTAGGNKHRCADFCHPRGLLEACLLLLMREAPAHGYELRARLARFGFEGQDPGAVYRALHGGASFLALLMLVSVARQCRMRGDGPERTGL